MLVDQLMLCEQTGGKVTPGPQSHFLKHKHALIENRALQDRHIPQEKGVFLYTLRSYHAKADKT